MDEIELGEVLESLAVGKALWLSARGSSLAPLLHSGDSLRVLRCSDAEVARGDIAVLKRSDGAFIAHLVRSTRPLTTASFLGRVDGPGLELLGRAIAVRRDGFRVPIPLGGRLPLWLLHLLASAAYRDPRTRAAARRARDLAASRWTLPLRRWRLGVVEVRRLAADDFRAALLFVSDHLSLPAELLRRQLPGRWQRTGAAAGALDSRGRMVGFAFLDEYTQEGVALEGFWFRYVFVAPIARNMGVARRLIEVLCAEARRQGITRVLADVRAANAASLVVFRAQGFTVAEGETARLNAMRVPAGGTPEWVVLERRLT